MPENIGGTYGDDMRKKRITKIICATVAAISAVTLAVAPACSVNWSGVSGDKETAASLENVSSNGGFLVETGDYVYFINGKANNTDNNKFGTVLKGSVQRLKKSDLENDKRNYSSTETVVPSVIYSGSYNAGIYIYGEYIYYTTPTTEKNTDGEVLNSNLDFKRTKLDGTDTTKTYIWQSSDNAVDYRFVEVGDTVYILYALSENLYGSSVTNIHSVNCNTGENVILAYNVTDYAFDTVDRENPYVYYTMAVPQFFGGSNYGYNQIYRVRADVKESPRTYDFSEVEEYDAEKDPVYINMGDFVFDGIGKVNAETQNRITQLNFAHYSGKTYDLVNDDYTYDLKWYKDGTLYYERKSTGGSSSLFTLTNADLDKDSDGKVDATWDAVEENRKQTVFLSKDFDTEYIFTEIGGKTYALNLSSSGITRSVVEDGKLGKSVLIDGSATSATSLGVREENGVLNLYYSVTGGSGYTVNRIAVDGEESKYRELESNPEPDLTYKSVKVLDLDACSGWYLPEFVGNNLFFASETEGVSSYNYIMVCDLTGKNGIMTNNEIDEFNDKYDDITEKIEDYDSETNPDGSKAYDGLSNALKYAFYTGDAEYIDTLVQAYVDIQGKDIEYIYSKESVKIFKDFVAADGDWASYKENTRKINGETVYANSHDYYYSVVGRMTEDDAEGLTEHFKTEYMKEYPVDDSTWWDGLSTGARVGFIIGMVACGLLVIGGVTFLIVFIVRRKKSEGLLGEGHKIAVDITDDKDMDVYGDGAKTDDGDAPTDVE